MVAELIAAQFLLGVRVMSVEDPRLSNISEENLTENFSSEIQEEIAASSTPSPIEHEIQVAQAGDGRTPTTGRVPTDQSVPAAAPAAPAAEVTPDVNNIVHLATSVSIDDIRVDGANLILVQADGTEIVIVNGAAKIPTMLIGEVEVPQQVLFAALEDSGINVAAGPDGSFSASGRPDSSGAEFDDSIQASQNDPIQLASLLGDTEFGDGGGLDDRTAADDQPDAFDMGSPFIFSEAVLADDVIGNETITGTLGFDGGDDFGIVSSVNYLSTSDMAEGTGSGVAAPLTSGGQAVTVSTSADGLTVTGTITVGETTVTVFTLTVTNPTTGAFTYTQSQPLDHPDLGQIGADDALRLNFTFTVTDKDGDSDTGSFSIEIGDDGPSINGSVTLVSVNEDDLSNGNDDGEARESLVSSADLGISWGADANVKGESEGDSFGRSIAFNSDGLPQNLTSGGVGIVYGTPTVSADGTVTITAYKGNVEGPAVFTVTLDPTSEHGTATFELKGPLDHASGSDALPLTFNYTATDADGDSQTGSFFVTVDDDIPVVGENALVRLDDDALTGGIAGGNGDDADSVNATGVLAHAYGADGAGSVLWLSNGLTLPAGFSAAPSEGGTVMTIFQGDRAVVSITITDTATGAYKVTQLAPINHPQGTIPGTEDNVQFTVSYQATDKDGDAAATPGTLTINVDDDIPTIGENSLVQLDDDALEGGNPEGNGDDADSVNATGVLAHAYGADGAGSVLWLSNGLTLPAGFSAAPSEGGTVMTIFQGDRAVVSITITDTATGAYKVTQLAPINHPQGTIPGTEDNVQFTVSYQATDKDGDAAATPGTLTINVDDDIPIVVDNDILKLDDDTLGGNADGVGDDTPTATSGILGHSFGADVAGSISWSGSGLTLPYGFWFVRSEDGSQLTITQNQNGTYVPVFKLVIDSASTGAYHVEQLATVNHAGTNPGFEDNISVTVSYDVKDGDNDVATGTLTIDLDDDTAKIGTPFAGGIVEEEQGVVIGAGNEDTSGTGDADALFGLLDRTTQTTGGTLAISWGSDNADNEAITSGAGNRSVAFGPAALANLDAQNLTSRGLELVYTLSADGTVLTAHAGTEGGPAVFMVTLSDNGSGTYSFTLIDTLDHPASGEDQIALNFQFTATDSDGDTTGPATFIVNVIDDVPTAGGVGARYVEEEALSGGNEDVSPLGVELTGAVLNGGPITDKIGASLNISWGGDDSNTVANGGFTGTQVMGDRSVVFAASGAAATVVAAADAAAFMTVKSGNTTLDLASLTSGGQALVYTLSANGTVLTAHAGTANGAAVFTVTLSDAGKGSYSFDLDGVLDHPVKASGANNEDVLTFNFTATARDSDGDIVRNSFQVNVIDDSPIANPGAASTVEDESVNSGNNETEDGYSAKAEHVSLTIQWGADNANDGNGQPGDRAVAFSNANVTVVGEAGNSLTSLGVAVHTAILANGALVGYTGNTAPTTTGAGNVVFFATVSDINNGEYNFTLVKPLDHDNSPANSENSLSLKFNYTATDSDGDTSSSTFTVNVVDDTAKIVTPFAGGIVEEEQGVVLGAGNEDTNGTGDADALFGLLDRTTQTTGGTLAISWGSDNADNEAITSGAGNRSVAFGPAALANLDAQNLTSRGLELVYTLSADGTVLTAHAGTEGGPAVFMVTLSDNGSGTYSFTLIDTLDHPASGEDQIALNFQFTATDSDGDTTGPATFIVNVIDDVPTAGGVGARYVEEEALSGGNEDVSPLGVELTGAVLNGGPITDKIGASLNISWGGDDSNTVANGGFTGTQVMGDRSVVFAASGAAATVVAAADAAAFMTVKSGNTTLDLASLTSGGQALVYTLSANGTVLTAHAGTANGAAVFTVTLSDAGKGSYSFDLDGVLDHPVKASGANNEDVLTFNFTATARDSDGDIVRNSFQVNVIDDSPVIAGPAGSGSLSEAGLPTVSFDFDSLNIKLGADNKNTHVAIGTDVHGAPIINANLTSDGVALDYVIRTTNGVDQELVAFKHGETVDNPVFIVAVLHPGSFATTLYQNLDHPAGSDNLTLNLVARVYDGDGDFVDQPFKIDVTDTIPTVGAAPAMQTVFEDGTLALSGVPLSISWGSDDANPNAGNNDRSITFAKPIAANNVTISGPAGALPNLTSNGAQVQFAFIGAYLVGFIGAIAPASATDAEHVVFNVLLSDLASGSYTFNLLQPLDHPAPVGTADYIDLAFTYHATDSDHDTTAEQTFVVRVDAAGTIDSINYSNLTSSVFVNLDDAAHTVLGQSVAGDRATDGALVADKIIGIDNVTGINDAIGGSADDILIGGDEANKLSGNGGDDYLDGGLGADNLDGGEGKDTFVLGADVTGSGTRNIQLGDGSLLAVNIAGLAGTADKVVGGAGNDTIILERDGKSGFVADYSTAPGYLSGVEKIVGTDGNDVILLAAGSTADGGPITIEGGDGNDILGGSNSADIINGGDGNDLISGLGGNDTLTGGNGDDVIWGGLGADTIHSGAGSDTIEMTADLTYAAGTLHSVPVVGLTTVGVDISGKAGTLDSINGGFDLGDTVYLKAGSEGFVLDGYQTNIEGVERIVGTYGDDVIVMRSDYVTDDGAGRTTIEGGLGNDTIVGGAGNDFLDGGQGADTLAGGDGADILKGGADNDALWGGKASDNLYGNGTTNQGSDLTATIGEADSANYGGPADKYRVFFNANAFNSGLGIWQVEALGGAPELMDGGSGSNTDNLYGIEKIQFNNLVLDLLAPVRLFNGNNLVGTFTTISDANTAAFAGFRIELIGTVTNQSATITKENLTVVGGAEDTGIVLTLDGVQNITLQGEAPIKVIGDGLSNTINGNDGANILEGGDGNDVLNGNGGDDSLFGGAGNDRFSGGTGINKMVGGTGNDQFFATGGTDTIHGNGEADIAATAGENDMVVYYGNQLNFAVTRMLDGGWQVLNTANGEIDKLYGVESINFNGGAIELDLTAPVQLFNGNNLVGTFTTISDANTAAFAGFRIELIGTVTNQSATITKENLTVVGGAEDTGIVLTLDGVQNITLQGEAPIKVIGDGLSNTINGNDGANILEGGDGNDVLNGNGGDDSLFGGAGNDRFSGGTGINKMVGGTGNDQFFATGGTDTIHGNGAADIAATAGENDMVVYYGNQSNFAVTRMLDGGWQVLNTANGEIDKLYGVESINFNGGAIELDLTAPVQLFNGNNLVGTFTTIGDANTAASTGFRIELVGTVTNQSATITKENLTVVGGAEDTGIVLTLDGVQNITLQGEAPIKVIGDGLSNTINGNDGANILEGGDGNDVLNGNGGNDTIQWSVGDGLDVIDGGAEPAGSDLDLLRVVGSSASEQYAIWSVAAYNAAHAGAPYGGSAEILLTVNGALAAEVKEIEDIVIQGGGGADTLAVNGSFAGTSLLTSTITYEGGEGDETFNVSELTSGHSVVVKGAGGADMLVIGDETGENVWKDVTVTQDPATGEFTISLPNGGPVLKATGVESFKFADGTVSAAQLIEQAPTDLTTSGLTVAENSAAGTIVGSVQGVDVNGSIDPLSYAFVLADSSTSLTSADGRFVINASTGEISVAAGAVLDYETTPSIGLSVLVTDSKNGSYSETFSVQLSNVNEAPILAAAIADQSILEEGTIAFQLPAGTFSDVDSALTYTATLGDGSPLPGWLQFNAQTGTFSGTAPLDYNGSLAVEVTATDGSYNASDTFNIDVTPVNDTPAAVADTNASDQVSEDGGVANGTTGDPSAVGNVLTNDTDVDTGDTKTVTSIQFSNGSVATVPSNNGDATVAGVYGTLTIHADGSYAYALDNNDADTQGLAQNASATEVFTYVMKDSGGLTSTASLAISITGANDAAVINGGGTGTVVEAVTNGSAGTPTASGDLNSTDVDNPNDSWTAVNTATASINGYGTYTIDASGHWTYALDNANPTVNALNTGSQLTDTFTVTTVDGTAKEVTVTITGTTDSQPVSVSEQASPTGRYAFTDNFDSPHDINFATSTLFSGGTGTISYTYALVLATDSDDWLHTGSTVSGNPYDGDVFDWDGDSGLYAYRITATDSLGSTQTSYVAFSAIEYWGTTINITANDNGQGQTFMRGWANSNNDDGDLILLANIGIVGQVYAGGGHDVVIGGGDANLIDGGSGDDAIYGMGGNDVLSGGTGTDFIDGGDGNDTIAGGDGNDVLLGGSGNDTFNYAIGDGADIIVGGTGSDTIAITGGSAPDSLTVLLSGGVVSQFNGVTVSGVESITANLDGGTDTLSYAGTTEAVNVNLANGSASGFSSISGVDNVTGGSGNDILVGDGNANILVGGNGADTLSGGGGADNLTGGLGNDTFKFQNGDSVVVIGGTNNNGTMSGYDVVTDFSVTDHDKLDFATAPFAAANTIGFNGVDSNLMISSSTIRSHAISNGIITFDNNNSYQSNSPLTLTSMSNVAAAVQYLRANDLGNAGVTVAFVATFGGVDHTFVYQQVGDNPNASNDILIDLAGVTLTSAGTSLATLLARTAVDPIILDLDRNGFAFTSLEDGVKFDINADGKLDQVAWTKTDGILAYDVDGNGKIDNGSEIFTPNFAGGAHAGGVAALSTLDVNHDGKIDASDTGFDKLLVWQDANGNGVSDEGELKGLNDYGITGISLDAESAEGYIDGQALFAEGSFTYADGSTGSFVEVGFDTLFSDAPDHVLVGTDGDDILAAMPGLTQMTGGAGADTFVLDPSALHELDMADIITDYKSNEGDAVDVSKLLDTLLGHQATGEEAAANVRTTIAGNDTTVSVQVATDSWKDVAVLQNHTEAVKILFDDDKHSANISHV